METKTKQSKGATLTSIAGEADVSVSVVSRFFGGDKTLRISQAKRKELIEIRNRLGGVRLTKVGRKRNVGLSHVVVCPMVKEMNSINMASSRTFAGFEAVLSDAGFWTSVNFCDSQGFTGLIDKLVSSPDYCDGIFLYGNLINEDSAKILLDSRFPHISVDYRSEPFGLNTSTAHAMGGLRNAVKHLREFGHERIGFLGRKSYRFPQLLAVLMEEGLQFDYSDLIDTGDKNPDGWGETWRQRGAKTMAGALDNGYKTTAIICMNDLLALGAIDAMKDRGLSVGKDISIVGYNNIEAHDPDWQDKPFITTIDNPVEMVGTRAGQLLLNQMLNKHHDIVHEYIPTQLIVRETTGPIPE